MAREQVAALARGWIGTPYHHHARIKGVGVDCVHLLCAVFESAGLVPPIDPGRYAPDWHLNRNEEVYAQAMDQRARRTGTPQIGDVALFRFGRTYSHGAIVVAREQLVHAYLGRGVVLTRLTEDPLIERSGQLREALYWDMTTLERAA